MRGGGGAPAGSIVLVVGSDAIYDRLEDDAKVAKACEAPEQHAGRADGPR